MPPLLLDLEAIEDHIRPPRLEQPGPRLTGDVSIDELGEVRRQPGGVVARRAPTARVERRASVDDAQHGHARLACRGQCVGREIGGGEYYSSVGGHLGQPRFDGLDHLPVDRAGLVAAGHQRPPGLASPGEWHNQLEDESPFRFGQLGPPVDPDRAHIKSYFAQLADYQDLKVLGGHSRELGHGDNPTPLTRNDHVVMVKADRVGLPGHTIRLYRTATGERPKSMAGVEIRHLSKRFGQLHAVDDVDLSIREGEFLVLLGPSGCGKTTLLRMIAGLERPTAGEIHIGGERMDDAPPRARGIAMVFQSYALYPHRTVSRNISFPLEALGLARGAIDEKVRWAAEMFGIGRYLDRYPRQLSGGERQRVALCRALVRDPKVFLLDEPLANLDAKLRNTARDELKRFQRRIKTTTVYVTHDQVEAMGLGDRIAVMDRGKVRQIGTPQEVYEEPVDTFVATFVGQPPMNLIAARDPALPPGTVLGFRPEHFLPRDHFAVSEPLQTFPFAVRRVEYLGSDRYVYGTIADGAGDAATVIAKLPATVGTTIPEGESLVFAVPRRALHYFDGTTGARRP